MKPCLALDDEVGAGLIVAWPTGVVYTTQAGGTSCLHPTLEGAFVPLANDLRTPTNELVGLGVDLSASFLGPPHRGSGANRGLNPLDADVVDQLLERHRFGGLIACDRARLADSREAWVWVTLLADLGQSRLALAAGFGPFPRPAVLTWPNSD